jgi:hypothetical protein
MCHCPTTPPRPKTRRFGLIPVRSPLLRESRLISFCRATEMFQFAHVPPSCLCVQQAVSRHHPGGVASFGISGFMACMQLPPNVSPVSASFIGLWRQGIHLVLCLTCVRCPCRGHKHRKTVARVLVCVSCGTRLVFATSRSVVHQERDVAIPLPHGVVVVFCVILCFNSCKAPSLLMCSMRSAPLKTCLIQLETCVGVRCSSHDRRGTPAPGE